MCQNWALALTRISGGIFNPMLPMIWQVLSLKPELPLTYLAPLLTKLYNLVYTYSDHPVRIGELHFSLGVTCELMRYLFVFWLKKILHLNAETSHL